MTRIPEMADFDDTADHPWPAPLLRAVGEAVREPAGRGVPIGECRKLARAAYLAAGGDSPDPAFTVHEMLYYLERRYDAWISGPYEAWLAANPES